MATIRAYTTTEQSRKLAEILPIESADMVLLHEEPYETSDSKFDGLHQALCVPFNKYDKSWRQKYKNISYFPYWSLASLLDVLPNGNMLVKATDGEYYCLTKHVMTKHYDNPIDACYELILKLHELNLM